MESGSNTIVLQFDLNCWAEVFFVGFKNTEKTTQTDLISNKSEQQFKTMPYLFLVSVREPLCWLLRKVYKSILNVFSEITSFTVGFASDSDTTGRAALLVAFRGLISKSISQLGTIRQWGNADASCSKFNEEAFPSEGKKKHWLYKASDSDDKLKCVRLSTAGFLSVAL